MPAKRSLFARVAVALLVCPPLSAQAGERHDPHLRNDCRVAAQVLQTSNPAPRREWALDTIRRCDESGPPALAEFWRRAAPSDMEELGRLFNVTRDFNDRRVVDAVAETARLGSAPETTRIYAMALLFNYAVPGIYIEAGDLLDPTIRFPTMGWVTHDDRADSTRALLGDLRPEVSEVLRSVTAAEPNSRVGVAAATVLRSLRSFWVGNRQEADAG